MNLQMLIVLLTLLNIGLGYWILVTLINLWNHSPKKKSLRALMKAKVNEERLNEKGLEKVALMISRKNAHWIHLKPKVQKEIQSTLDRLKIKQTPEEHFLLPFVFASFYLPLPLLFWLWGMHVFAVLSVFAVLLMYAKVKGKTYFKIQEKRRLIQREFPRFYMNVKSALTMKTDVQLAFEKYLKMTKGQDLELEQDLRIAVMQMQVGRTSEALEDLDDRLNIDEYSDMIDILRGISEGAKSLTDFSIIDAEVKTRRKHHMEEIAKEEKGKLVRRSAVNFAGIVLLHLLPILLDAIDGFKMF